MLALSKALSPTEHDLYGITVLYVAVYVCASILIFM